MRRDFKIYLQLFGMTAVLVGISIEAAVFFQSAHNDLRDELRAPASIDTYNESGELVMSEVSLADLDVRGANVTGVHAPLRSGPVFSDLGSISREEAFHRSGVACLRGRHVRFHREAFIRQLTSTSQQVELSLFSDTSILTSLQSASRFSVNRGIYTGQIDSDPESRVQLFVAGNSIGGTIQTGAHHYRILDGGDGTHYIVEEDVQASRAFDAPSAHR